MAKTRLVKGKWCRYYYDGYIWVPEDGSAATTLDEKKHYKSLKIVKDDIGKYAKHPWGHCISMASAVITCYCPPMPNDGKKYIIGFKDCNKQNCHKDNLFWKEYHYEHTTKDIVKLIYKESTITVHHDGTVDVDGTIKPICNYMYDSDTDLHISIAPHLRVRSRSNVNGDFVDIDDLMRIAGFIQGDDADMNDPKILHVDYDWMNFNFANLLWVEREDPRYKEYLRVMTEAMNKRTIEVNPNRDVPNFMLRNENGGRMF